MNGSSLYLREQDRRQFCKLLAKYLPGVTAWAYGSRVKGEAHDTSDLDVVLRSPDLQPIAIDRLEDFLDAVRESNIPILIEARDWTRLPDAFHAEILKNYVALAER